MIRSQCWSLLALFTMAMLANAPAATHAGPSETSAEIEKGRQLAERMCAICHLNPGQGEKTAASSIPGFAAVANRPGQTIEGIVAWLASVPPMMPNHHLSGDERVSLAAYILSLSVQDLEPVGRDGSAVEKPSR
ncbi:MAG: cytochrome c [Hyphomicrobiaceae bacterium]|nr:cytochrome c [Hyphomicrobiaceae bacterium]